MKRCYEGEAWFCSLQDVVEAITRLLGGGARTTSRGDCTLLEHPRLSAEVCRGPRGRLGSLEYESCRVLIDADPALCGRVKIILMRGGG